MVQAELNGLRCTVLEYLIGELIMEITGKIPSLIANRLPQLGDNIIVTGSDIDIQVKDKGNISTLYAVRVGSDWEISELDDSANVFPEYDEADIISADVITKFFTSAITNSLILSFNPLGKVRYGIKDKVDVMKGKIQKGLNWLTDKITVEDAQNLIREQPGFESAKVGKVDLMNRKWGGNYKVLAGNPSDKSYSVWQIYRNGNEYRILKKTTGLSAEQAVEKYDSLAGTHYDGTKGEVEEEPLEEQNVDEGTQETTTEETAQPVEETPEENNVTETPEEDTYDEEGLKYAKMNSPDKKEKRKFKKAKKDKDKWEKTDDGVEYMVAALIKSEEDDNVLDVTKKKKKSKYNGCNVTGCEDGNLAGEGTVM